MRGSYRRRRSSDHRTSSRDPLIFYGDWSPPGPWVGQGLCLGSYSDIFFPYKGGSSMAARRVCARCPVWRECLDYATFVILATDGVWGGTTQQERQRLRSGSLTIEEVTLRLARLKGHLRSG